MLLIFVAYKMTLRTEQKVHFKKAKSEFFIYSRLPTD